MGDLSRNLLLLFSLLFVPFRCRRAELVFREVPDAGGDTSPRIRLPRSAGVDKASSDPGSPYKDEIEGDNDDVGYGGTDGGDLERETRSSAESRKRVSVSAMGVWAVRKER